MRGVFREDHNMFRDQARRFVDREIVPYLHECHAWSVAS